MVDTTTGTEPFKGCPNFQRVLEENLSMIVSVRFFRAVCMSIVVALAVIGTAFAAEPISSSKKVCIAHAGASQYAPAHTLAAYALALKMGADYVEQDLQLTKDGVLICIHDATLERCTNAEDVFPSRHRTIERDGAAVRTWPVVDFTLEEIRTLDAGSWFDPSFADQRVVTFQESLDMIKGKARN
jgi:glycerophosphoryl diester phosphodiesterase